eukprot:135400-Pyramimonas_sp.AAC.1
MNVTAASEAVPIFGSRPSGSVRQPGTGFRSKRLWCRDFPSTERKPPLEVHSEGDQGYTIEEPPLCHWGDHAKGKVKGVHGSDQQEASVNPQEAAGKGTVVLPSP